MMSDCDNAANAMEKDGDEDRASFLKRLGLVDLCDPKQAEDFAEVSRQEAQASVQRMLHSKAYKEMADACR